MGILYVYDELQRPGRIFRAARIVSDFPTLVNRLLAAGEKVCAFPTDCLWLDIGRPDDYARAQELFATRRHKFEHA